MSRAVPWILGIGLVSAFLLLVLWLLTSRPGTEGEVTVDPGEKVPEHASETFPSSPVDKALMKRERLPVERALPSRKEPDPGTLQKKDRSGRRLLMLEVTDSAGVSVAGAYVGHRRRSSIETVEEGYTDPQGRIDFHGVCPGDEVSVEAAGFFPRYFSMPEPPWPAPFRVVLEKGNVLIEGYVTDESRQPVEGAEVRFSWKGGGEKGRSDEKGFFVLVSRKLPAFPLTAFFTVSHKDYCGFGRITLNRPGERVSIVAKPWARLRVRVYDPQGKVLPGAGVSLAGPPGSADRRSLPVLGWVDWIHAVTRKEEEPVREEDAECDTILLTRVPPGLPLWLLVRGPGYEEKEVALGVLTEGEDRFLEVGLDLPLETLTVNVMDATGNPPPKIEASYSWIDGGWVRERGLDRLGEGRFTLHVPKEAWELRVRAPGYAPYRKTFPPAWRCGGSVDVVLEPSVAEIRVRVVDGNGAPVPGVHLQLDDNVFRGRQMALGTPGVNILMLQGVTDAEGAYRFKDLDEHAEYEVRVTSWSLGKKGIRVRGRTCMPQPFRYRKVRPGGDPLVITMVPAASLEGRISGDGTEAGRTLRLTYVEGSFTVSATTGPKGRFRFHALPPGTYHLFTEENVERPLAVVHLQEGEQRRDLLITLR